MRYTFFSLYVDTYFIYKPKKKISMEEKEKKQNIVTINGMDYTLKPGMKAILVFEKIAEKAFEIKNTTDVVTYIYAAMVAGTPGLRLGFDELLDAFDDDPNLLKQCTDAVMSRTAVDKLMQLANENDGGPEPKKG